MSRTKCHCVMLGALLYAAAAPLQADIYAYVDSNGVRHITNNPNGDPRYKLVMRTPQYQQPASPPANTEQVALAGTIETADGRWQLIRPRNHSTITLTNPPRRGGQPFRVNEANRAQYAPVIQRAALRHGLDPHLVHAVISAESAYNPRAVSRAGAMGLMQLMPATAERFGVGNAFDPAANVDGGVRYLRWLLNHFDNNLTLALAGYNAGEGAVIRHGHQIPPYAETRTYVDRVMRFYNHYRGQALASQSPDASR